MIIKQCKYKDRCDNYLPFVSTVGFEQCAMACQFNPMQERLNFYEPYREPQPQQEIKMNKNKSRKPFDTKGNTIPPINEDSYQKNKNKNEEGFELDAEIEYSKNKDEIKSGVINMNNSKALSASELRKMMQAQDNKEHFEIPKQSEFKSASISRKKSPDKVITPNRIMDTEDGKKICPVCGKAFKNLTNHLRLSDCGRNQ